MVVEDLVEDSDGLFGQSGGLVMPEHRAFAGGKFEFAGEGGVGAAPGADGVAVDAGGGCGFRGGDALSEEWARDRGLASNVGFLAYWGLPGSRISAGAGGSGWGGR